MAVLVAVVLVLSGCSLGGDDEVGARREAGLAAAVDDLLVRRTRAVLRAQRRAFLATVDRSAAGWRRQERWFETLSRLPVGQFSSRVRPGTLEVRDASVVVVVRSRLQLRGFDAWPVTSDHRLVLRRDERRWVVSLVATVGDARPDQPWEHRRVQVVRRGAALGIFDGASPPQARRLTAAVDRALDAVDREVPFRWRRSVVFYALSDTRFMSRLPRLPGGDPQALDAVTFPVGPRGGRYAAMRVVLHPRVLAAPAARRDRLLRHELTHVALGARADGLPVWLSEGVAELVSVRAVPPRRRTISAGSLRAARRGFRALPDDDRFGTRSQAHYGLAWWACEVIVTRVGERGLWDLVRRLAEDGPGVLESVVGLGERELAAAAGRRIVRVYG